jgi:hypothetical protein
MTTMRIARDTCAPVPLTVLAGGTPAPVESHNVLSPRMMVN